MEDGQLDPHLELHLVQYAADPSWRADWAARRYSGSGLIGQYGSTTASDLHVSSQIALNVFPLERLQIRYDRRDYQDGRFDLEDQRFEVIWYPGTGWGVVVSGWPAHEKERASMGAGVRLGSPRGTAGLVVQVVDDRFLWNEKATDTLRFKRDPLRLLADGYLEVGDVTIFASIDHGLGYEAVESTVAEGTPARSTRVSRPMGETSQFHRTARGSQSLAELAAGYTSAGWTFSARLTAAWLDREQEVEGEPAPLSLDRGWGRLLVDVRRRLGEWSASAQAGYAFQRDRFSSSAMPDGCYRADTVLLGVEAGRRLGKALELRVGYLGSVGKAEREVPAAGPLVPREESGYVDKAHARALYAFGPSLSVEALLSQTISGSRFGGGSVKARLVF